MVMPRRIDPGAALLCAAVLALAGCGTASSPRKTSATASASTGEGAQNERKAEKTDYSASAVERRTEAHARYAAAILHDWDDEPELAAAEYLKAALADAGNEPLVLEVSQRLLQLKKNEQALQLLSKATAQPGASGALL